MVHKSVFSKLTYPYFNHSIVEMDGKASEIGEDIGFCKNLIENDVELWCDFDIKIGHEPKRMRYLNVDLDSVKPDPSVLIKDYYNQSNFFIVEAERMKARSWCTTGMLITWQALSKRSSPSLAMTTGRARWAR